MTRKKSRKKHKRPVSKPAHRPAEQINAPLPVTIPAAKPVSSAVVPPAKIAPATAAVKVTSKKTLGERLENYLLLMRLDRPIGILLLLWPTYWTLWLAADGLPSAKNLLIFAWGCILMRSAGCVMNDYADRHIDGKVKRTKDRMIVAGKVSPREALILFVVLCAAAFALVCLTNPVTILLSIGGLLLATIYPFAKRYTHLPQVVLGMAFAWSIPMAWTAEHGSITSIADFKSVFVSKMWLVYFAVVIWALIYDTFYAMVDRNDDIRIGVKSTAILFGDADRAITAILQALMIFTLVLVGRQFELEVYYYSSLVLALLLFIYQQYLIRDRKPEQCFKAFLNNNYVGLIVFIGIAADYYFASA